MGGAGAVKIAEAGANHIEAVFVIFRHVMRHAADCSMQMRAAESFLVDRLPGCTLHQIGAAKAHEAGFFHHDDDVAECRKVRAAGDARTHDRRDLRHMQLAAHQRIIEKDSARPYWPGKIPS